MSTSDGAGPPSARQMEAALAAVGAALNAGDEDQAMRLAETAVQASLAHPLLFNLAAAAAEKRFEFDRAVALLESGLRLDPENLELLTALGLCLNKLSRSDAAMAAFSAVLARQPQYAPARYGAGVALMREGQFESARRELEAAASLWPGYADPIGSLAALQARLGDVESARASANRALGIDSGQIAGRTALAMCEVASGAHDHAEALARGLAADKSVPEDDRATALIVLGDALDGLGRTGDAFAAYVDAKSIRRRISASQFERPGLETYPQLLSRVTRWISDLDPGRWTPAPGVDQSGARGHVFIVGFARSGTTLLETALASHPDIVSLDEFDCFGPVSQEAFASAESLNRLAALDAATAAKWRETYWSRVDGAGVKAAGKVFVDKSPFGSLLLPLVSALFPQARVLFALRDPRDVVLSCFRQNFSMNPTTFEMTSLEGTARCYDGLMSLAMLYRERLPLNLRETRYEDVSGDFENEVRAITEFIGLEWTPEMREFAKTAQGRPSRTPSARQLVRGLYSGAGQWRRYEAQLEPVLPILQPWIERFGYAVEAG